jgi:nucleotide-binding universal stress UspA family protein
MENSVIPSGTVVVGVDGSSSCERALEWAVDDAVLERRQLTLAHGFDPVRPQGRNADDPAEVLARESPRMDLVVLGAPHGGVLHASVTSAVIEHAACPVAVVPLPVGGSGA